jgi:hypothetical protein
MKLLVPSSAMHLSLNNTPALCMKIYN